LKSMRLDSTNCYGGTVFQSLAPGLTRDYNQVEIIVGQLLDIECTPPFDPALWTTISGDSYLYVSYTKRIRTPDLARFPFPFYDPLTLVPEPVYFLSEPGIDSGLFSKVLDMAALLGRKYEWRRGDISAIRTLDQWGNGPLVVTALSGSPLVKEWSDKFGWNKPGQPVKQGTLGMLKMFNLYGKPVLLVCGKDSNEIKKAFDSLLYPEYSKLLNSDSAQILKLDGKKTNDPLLLGKSEPRSITFRELGIDNFTLRGGGPVEQAVNIPLLFGSSIPEFEAHMNLVYSYSSQVNPNNSSIEIQLGNISISGIPLNEQKGVTLGKEQLTLPHNLINGPFSLSFYAHLWPAQMDFCKWTPSEYPWFTIFDTSSVTLPRDIYLKMPELKWFRLWGYPFTDNPGNTKVRIEYEDSVQAQTCALNLAFFLGTKSRLLPVEFEAVPVSDSSRFQNDSNVIRIFTRFPGSAKEQDTWNPVFRQEVYDKIYKDTNREYQIRTGRKVGGFEESLLNGKEKVILGIHCPDPENLKHMVKLLGKSQSVAGFSGALVICDTWENETAFNHFKAPELKQWGSLSTGRKAKRFFLDNLWQILILAPVVLFLLYLGLRILKHFILKKKKKEGDGLGEEGSTDDENKNKPN
jgi:hypothetical protein